MQNSETYATGPMHRRYDRWQYALTMSIILLACMCCYFPFVIRHFQIKLIKERREYCAKSIAYISTAMDYMSARDNNWMLYDYKAVLNHLVLAIQEESVGGGGAYAVLFDRQWNQLSSQAPLYCGRMLDLRDYPDVVTKCDSAMSGYAQIEIAGDPDHERTLFLYWRWLPLSAEHEDMVLFVVGVSKYSIDMSITHELVQGAFVLIILSSVLVVGCVIIITVSRSSRRRTDNIPDVNSDPHAPASALQNVVSYRRRSTDQ